MNTPKKLSWIHKIWLKKGHQIRFWSLPFLFRGTHFGNRCGALLFRVWGCGRKHINIYGGHGRGNEFHFYGSVSFTNGKETKHWHSLSNLNEDRLKTKRPGKLVVGKLWVQKEPVTKKRGKHGYTVDDIRFWTSPSNMRAGNVTEGSGGFAVWSGRGVSLTLQAESGPWWRPGLMVDWSAIPFYCSGSYHRFQSPVFPTLRFWCDAKKSSMPVRKWNQRNGGPDALVIILLCRKNCITRPLINEEIEGMQQVWDVPYGRHVQ